MSKGTNNSNDSGMSMQYLGDLIQKILDSKTTSVDPVSQEFYNKLLSNFNTIVGILKDDKQVTTQELKKIVNYTKSTLSTDYGVKFTERFNKSLSQFEKTLEDKIKNEKGKVDANKLVASLSNIVASAVAQSLRAEQRGSKGALLRGVSKDSSEMKALADEIAKKIGMEQVADGAMAKLIGFFKGEDKEKEKKLKKFGEDLIEGLANNKFVGGALTDTFKLIGLMGASWLSQFGQLGRILGGAFYVAMSTAGPLLVNSLLKGMGNLLAKGIVSLGKFIGTQGGRLLGAVGRGTANLASSVGRGAMDLSLKAGGPLADLATAGTTGQKALAVGRVAGGAAMGLAAGAGALYAGKEAISDWKSGHKGRAASFGVGGLALGAGAIAAVIAGAFAPVTLILVGIGGAIVGLTALWKHHGDAIKGFFKKISPFFGKVMDFIMMVNPIFMVIKKVMDWILQTKVGEKIKEGVVNAYNNVKDAIFGKSQDTQQVEAIGNMGVNKAGGMLNVRGMNKVQASQAVSEYLKNRPDQFNNIYELSGSKHSYLGSFTNDLAIRNAQGQAQQAVLYKGAGADLEGAWQHLVSSGAMTQERAELLKYTSGRATASSKHKKGGARSHDNVMNMVTDLGTANKWTDSEWEAAFNALKSYYADKGYDLYYEGETAKGETKFGQEFVAGLSNRHFHIAPSKGKEGMMPAGAEENIKQREARAEQHSINAISLMQKLEGKEGLKEIYKEHGSESPEEFGEAVEKEFGEAVEKKLKDKYGIYSRKDQEGKEHWIYQNGNSSREFNPDGNLDFAKAYITHVSNEGA